MRFTALLTALLFLLTRSFAQLPEVTSSDITSPITLQQLDIDVKIIGNRSVTTFSMTFHNASYNVLEGTFLFPLPEGAMVTRYALDINGKMREGVPVEKNKATEVFESIEKRRIDPGLLEQTEGNVYRTRIYPFNAEGDRRIIISYQQELKVNTNTELQYFLPLSSAKQIDEFSLNIQVEEKTSVPVIESSPFNGLTLQKFKNQYCAYQKKNRFQLTNPLTITIAKHDATNDVFTQKRNGEQYFYLQSFFPSSIKDKPLPKRIAVIWDISLSGIYRNIEKEISVLEAYVKHCGDVSLELYTLNNDFKTEGIFHIKQGAVQELSDRLQKMSYDGGTDYSKIKFPDADETLFFTDGLSTLSAVDELTSNHLVYTLSSSGKASYTTLKNIAEINGGVFINLNTNSESAVITQLTKQSLMFLGIKENKDISECYPSLTTPVFNRFSMAGKFTGSETSVTLLFGYGQTVAFEKQVNILPDEEDAAGWNLTALLAQKEVEELDKDYEKNKEQILRLARQHRLVTRNTSLLVLEDIADYVEYNIEPPVELMEEYKRLLKEKEDGYTKVRVNTLDNAIQYSSQLWEWWKTEFPERHGSRNRKQFQHGDTVETHAGLISTMRPVPGVQVDRLATTSIILEAEAVANSKVHFEEPEIQLQEIAAVTTTAIKRKENPSMETTPINRPLLIVDGIISNNKPPKEQIDFIEILEPAAAIKLYGAKALYGVQLITTKGKKTTGPEININEKTSTADYLKQLAGTSKNKRWALYLQLREKNLLNPTFYYDVANYFLKEDKKTGLQVLTNLAELDYENHELLKLFAFKLKEVGELELQRYIFKKILHHRPQEPQSYRDYALALIETGSYQAALDTLYLALTREYHSDVMQQYRGIEETILMEINNLVSRYSGKLNTSVIRKELLHQMPVDIRVVLNWNMNDTDIDLWITDPNGEKCFYEQKETAIGGRLSDDFIQGYGPEQFILKNAMKGKYKIQVHYYGNNAVKIAGKTTLLVEIFTNYGRDTQHRRLITLQLEEEEKEGIYVGEFIF